MLVVFNVGISVLIIVALIATHVFSAEGHPVLIGVDYASAAVLQTVGTLVILKLMKRLKQKQ